MRGAEAGTRQGWTREYGQDEWRRRRAVAANYVIPWLHRLRPLKDATVLEYGVGTGAVSCAFAPYVARHIGYDIDADAVAVARGHVERAGARNVELHAVEMPGILDAVRAHRGELDMLLLYAVLEHMSVRERLDLLELALEVVEPDGLLVVVETPNRLVSPDWHTSFLPFYSQLPDELALAYLDRSPREDFREAVEEAVVRGPAAGRMALTRWGRGASFHEFELVFGDLGRHVLAGGYEPELLRERPVHREELSLARYLERVRPDLPPAFSRYWLDFVLSPRPLEPGATDVIWPWVMDTRLSPGASWTASEIIELGGGQPLIIEPPCPTTRIIANVAISASDGEARLETSAGAISRPLRGKLGVPLDIDFRLAPAASRVSLTLSHPGNVYFVGYEAPLERLG